MKISTGPEIYRFKHEEVIKRFEGDLSYIGEMMIRGNCWAVYKAANPNREKGHKDYMMLGEFAGRFWVSGCTEDEMSTERWQNAIMCRGCGEILFSKFTHDYKTCSCENRTMIDGGGSYQRYGGKQMGLVRPIKYDAISGEVKDA